MSYNPFDGIVEILLRIEDKLDIQNRICETIEATEVIDRKELMKRLAITEPTVIRLEKKSKIPYMVIGSSKRYKWQDVLKATETKIEAKRQITCKYVKLTEKDGFPIRSYKKSETPDVTIRYIYIMRNKANWLYKIGISSDVKFREKTLMSSEPYIELLHKWAGEEKDERLIHEKFSDYRLRGEWFTLNNIQLEEIISYMNSIN
jgi:hypothetical protein